MIQCHGDIGKTSSKSIGLLYVGGTFGVSGKQKFLSVDEIVARVPEIKRMNARLSVFSFLTPMDSSDMEPKHWQVMAQWIRSEYQNHQGFVLLHGTDTMAYTASMLSYMLRKLSKPVVLTGAQVPLKNVRSDARENLISALEIVQQQTMTSEVCIYFNSLLLRGNRTSKVHTNSYLAFRSLRYPALAKVGARLSYNEHLFLPKHKTEDLLYCDNITSHVALIKVFPGMGTDILQWVLEKENLRGVLLETLGSGNIKMNKEMIQVLKKIVAKGLLVAQVSQVPGGQISTDYAAGQQLQDLGIVSGQDMTSEAALTKMMFLLASHPPFDREYFRQHMASAYAGECGTAP